MKSSIDAAPEVFSSPQLRVCPACGLAIGIRNRPDGKWTCYGPGGVSVTHVVSLDKLERSLAKSTAVPVADLSRFPHRCLRCGAPAFNGFSSVDCSAGCKP